MNKYDGIFIGTWNIATEDKYREMILLELFCIFGTDKYRKQAQVCDFSQYQFVIDVGVGTHGSSGIKTIRDIMTINFKPGKEINKDLLKLLDEETRRKLLSNNISEITNPQSALDKPGLEIEVESGEKFFILADKADSSIKAAFGIFEKY